MSSDHVRPRLAMLPEPTLTTVAHSEVSLAVPISLRREWLTFVQPLVHAGSPGRARVYAEVSLVRRTDAEGEPLAVLWSGYVRSRGTPASIPNMAVDESMAVMVRCWATTTGIRFGVHLGSMPFHAGLAPGAGSIFYEAPGSGRGDKRVIDLGNPAAGAEYPAQTPPARSLWSFLGFFGSLVTDASAPGRKLQPVVREGALTVAPSTVTTSQAASSATEWAFAATGSISGTSGQRLSFLLPVGLWDASHSLVWSTLNLAAGDDWGQGYLLVEEWATP